ncbi:carbohydrate ABC transporter permease [Bauldia sp.]|uniref:carbohydrate ABC transporter permease n=1 Tax=Bauldia sp. TaxID=2575872 RepID=UPI003BA9D6DE
MNARVAGQSISRAWAYVFTGAMVLFSLFPVYWVLTVSLKSRKDGLANPPMWIFDPIVDNYVKLWEHTTFKYTFLNSVIITAIGVTLSLAIALPAAYAVCRLKVRGARWINLWLILAYMLPEFLFIIPMFSLYQWTGLYDTHIGLALIYQVHVLPLSIWLLSSFFREINPAIDEAARIEGCSHWQVLIRIYVPCALPGVVATAILNAIWIWNELAIALGLTFSRAETVTLGVTSFRGYAALDWGAMTAASIVAIIPMFIFAIFAQKHIVKGLTLGAVKG